MSELLAANTIISHYRIVSKTGAGGMGEAYRARDERLDREVAIKALPSEFANHPDRLVGGIGDDRNNYVPSPDGPRFLINALARSTNLQPLILILNWLKR